MPLPNDLVALSNGACMSPSDAQHAAYTLATRAADDPRLSIAAIYLLDTAHALRTRGALHIERLARADIELAVGALRARRDAFRFDALTSSPDAGAADGASADALQRVLVVLLAALGVEP